MANLTFPVDRPLRRRLFTEASYAHPAKADLHLLTWIINTYTRPGQRVADPMAGIGGLLIAALLQRDVIVREIEPRWLAECHHNAARILEAAGLLAGRIDVGQGDAREPWGFGYDVIVTSPPYGCDASANAFRAKGILSHKQRLLAEQPGRLGDRWRSLAQKTPQEQEGAMASLAFHYGSHPAQIGHWRGKRYWVAMAQIYLNAFAALRPGGRMILILKDHIRKGKHARTCDHTITLCEGLGFTLEARHARKLERLSLWQRRRRERGEAVIDVEEVLVFRKKS